MSENTKKCPYCAEEIKAEAIYCRFCNHDLSKDVTKPNPTQITPGSLMPPVPEKKAVNEKKEKNKKIRNIILILILLAIVVFCIMSQNNRSGSSYDYDYSPPVKTTHHVKYILSGSASTVDITIENEGGNTEQYGDVPLPKEFVLTVEDGSFVYISAQNQGKSGSVTCKITVDGVVIETATSSGSYVIATCSGRAEK